MASHAKGLILITTPSFVPMFTTRKIRDERGQVGEPGGRVKAYRPLAGSCCLAIH
jgi:hypothetical protein